MWKLATATLLTVLACPVVFTTLQAGIFCGHPLGSCSCNPCSMCQSQPCGCALQVSYRPPGSYRPGAERVPQVTYGDVTRTEYRMQAESKQVPVTRYRNVTLDRGAWHKIWVPKMVTQQVPETIYETRISYRQVPYQVTQRVPQTTYTTLTTTVPTQIPVSAGYHTCAPTIATLPASPVASQPVVPRTAAADPAHADLRPLKRIAESASHLAPVPDPRYLETPRAADSDWINVTPRASSRDQAPVRTSSADARFIAVPSAASVLRARSTRLR